MTFDSFVADFARFWALVQEVWHTGVFGRDFGRVIVAVGVFMLFFLARGVFTRTIVAQIDRLVARTSTDIDDQLRDAIVRPLKFIFVILGVFFAAQALDLSGEFAVAADNVSRSLITVGLFWAFYNAVGPLSGGIYHLERVLTPEMVNWLITGVKWAIVLIGGATVLQIWGIQVGPIIAGLGLFGVAVALGAQDLFKNLIGGMSILVEKRFSLGDWIKVEGVVEGTVENIGFRSTLVRRFDLSPVFVPNQRLADNPVTNFSAMTYRRIYWTIGLEYRTTSDQLRQVRDGIEAYIRNSGQFVLPPDALLFVRVDVFSSSSIDIMIYCFTRTTVWGEWLEIKEALAYEIKRIVEGAGAGFAFPSQSIYVEKIPPAAGEIAVHAGTGRD